MDDEKNNGPDNVKEIEDVIHGGEDVPFSPLQQNVNNENQDLLIKLLEQLSAKQLSNESYRYIETLLNQIFAENSRPQYTVITSYCFNDLKIHDGAAVGQIILNLENVPERLSSADDSNNKIFNGISKISDHVNLASQQFELVQDTKKYAEDEISELQKESQELKKQLETSKSDLQSAEKNITNQIISIVGIFTALAFLLFGGISSLGTIASLVEVEFAKVLAFGTVWLFCMFNILGLFVYFILRITGRITEGITKRTTRTTDSGDKKGCAIFKAFFSRYGLFVSIDLVLLAIGIALYFAMRR